MCRRRRRILPESFQVEIELRPAGHAEIDGDSLTAALGRLCEGGWFAGGLPERMLSRKSARPCKPIPLLSGRICNGNR